MENAKLLPHQLKPPKINSYQKKPGRVNFCLMMVLLAALATSVSAAEEEGFWKKTSIDLKLAYASKYLWRGYDLWNDGPALQPDLYLGLGGTGIYAGIWSSYSIKSGCTDPFGDKCSDWNEHDYYFGYYNSLWNDSRFKTDYDVSYTFYSFFKLHGVDTQEIALALTHPNLLPEIGGSRPALYWTFYYGWPVHDGIDSLWLKLGLKHEFAVWGQQNLKTLIESVWDDGAAGFQTGEGWSHVKVGAATKFEWGALGLEPALYYQWKTKDHVPSALCENEFWFMVSLSWNIKPF